MSTRVRDVPQADEIFRIAVDSTILYLVNFLIFFKMNRNDIPSENFNRFAGYPFPCPPVINKDRNSWP